MIPPIEKEILLKWIESGNEELAILAIKNPNADKDIFMKAITTKYRSEKVKYWVVRNCNGDKDILHLAFNSYDPLIRQHAVRESNGDYDILKKAINDESFNVKEEAARIAAKHKNIDILRTAIQDQNKNIRAIAVKSGYDELVKIGLNDMDRSIRDLAIYYCDRTFEPPKLVYNRCVGDVIVVATIPKDALIRGNIGEKCRTNKAKIIDILHNSLGVDFAISRYDFNTTYKIGDEIEIKDFDRSNNKCFNGFYFFCSEEEAMNDNF